MNSLLKIIFNGIVLEASNIDLIDNRSFRYGDGLFESIRVINRKPHNMEAHYDRLKKGIEVLSISGIETFKFEKFKSEIIRIIEVNQIAESAKVRVHVFRSGKGTYLSDTDLLSYIITIEKMDVGFFKLNSEGLKLDIYQDIKKTKNILSNLKTSNGLLYVMALNFAKKNNLDDCFIINQDWQIIESAKSNLFLVSNGVLYTPPLADGCVGGTMRMKLINIALANRVKVYESSLTPQNLLIADEVILTNAIQGLQWVGSYKSKIYTNQITRSLVTYINESIAIGT